MHHCNYYCFKIILKLKFFLGGILRSPGGLLWGRGGGSISEINDLP